MKAMSRERANFTSNTCPVCGKSFVPAAYHVYRTKTGRTRFVCSYHCMLASERDRIQRKNGRMAPEGKKGGCV